MDHRLLGMPERLLSGGVMSARWQSIRVPTKVAQRLQHQVRDGGDAERFCGLHKDLQILDEQASRIGRPTDQIKAILRNANTSLSRLDLVNVLESMRLYVASNLKEARGWVSIKPPADLGRQGAWVDGDAVQLQIAVINLLKNAVDALGLHPPATVPPQIVISLERQARSWAIVVDDNGPGLPDDHPANSLSPLPNPQAAVWACSSCVLRWKAITVN